MPRCSDETVVIAIDPGRDKCGIAAVSSSGEIVHREIVAASQIGKRVSELASSFPGTPIALGDGTSSAIVLDALQSALPGARIDTIPEAGSTESARERYWQAHPPRGWRRLAPRSLLSPPEPVDDFAAALIAERWWSERSAD
jgi:RNase H-fold protein (predicted Holliday junction resolvase)